MEKKIEDKKSRDIVPEARSSWRKKKVASDFS
jgi:hypothetical protein